jgi:hypothetical protein
VRWRCGASLKVLIKTESVAYMKVYRPKAMPQQHLKPQSTTSMNQQTGENLMKKTVLVSVFLIVLIVVLVAPVHASVSVESTVGDNIYIIYNFENLDPAIYNEAIANQKLFNSSTIPQIIVKNLKEQNLTHVNYWQPNLYNATETIRVSFYLNGSDIISFTNNRTTMKKTYQVKTEWRKFQVNLTSSFSIDFAQYFAEPVEKWQLNQTTYYYETHGTGFFDVLSFKLTLPATATNIQAKGDTITYEVPLPFWDIFLNSPFLILTLLIIIIIVALIYRRVR